MAQLIELSSAGIPGPAGPPGSSGALSITFSGSSGLIGSAFAASLIAVGGMPPYTFSISVGTLPTGLTLNTATGAITGTPTVVGSSTFTGLVTDASSSTATMVCTLVFSLLPAPVPSAPNIAAATATPYFTFGGNGPQNLGIQGVVTLPTGDPNYSHLSVVEAYAIDPAGNQHFLARLDALGINLLRWSEDLTNATGWGAVGTTTITGPHTVTLGTGYVYAYLVGPITAGQQVTLRLLLSGTGTMKIGLEGVSGTSEGQDSPLLTLTSTPTWQTVTRTFALAHTSCDIYFGQRGGTATSCTVGAAQAYYGAIQPPYVKTTTTAATGGTIPYAGIVGSQPLATETWGAKFIAINEAGAATVPPFSLSGITVNPPAISYCAGVDASILLITDPNYHADYKDSSGAIHTVLNATVSAANQQYPMIVTLWLNTPTARIWQGWFNIAADNTVIPIGLKGTNTVVYPPVNTAENWSFTAAPGAIGSTSPIPTNANGGLDSAAFTVQPPPTPLSTWISNAAVDQLVYFSTSSGFVWCFGNISFAAAFDYPYFKAWQSFVQKGTLTGSVWTPAPASDRESVDRAFNGGDETAINVNGVVTTGNLVSMTRTWPWTMPLTADPNKTFRIRIQSSSRLQTGGTDAVTTAACWTGTPPANVIYSADHLYAYLTPDPSKALTILQWTDSMVGSGLNITAGKPQVKYGLNVGDDGTGAVTSVNSVGSNMLSNSGFENGLLAWGLYNSDPGMNYTLSTAQNHTFSGKNSLSLTGLVNGKNSFASQFLQVLPARNYSFHSWVTATAGTTGNVVIYVVWIDVSGVTIGAASILDTFPGPLPAGWQSRGGFVKSPPLAASAQFVLQVTGTGSTGNVFFDDAEVYLLPATNSEFGFDPAGNLQMVSVDLTKVNTTSYSSDFQIDGTTGKWSMKNIDMRKASGLSGQFTTDGTGTSITNLSAGLITTGQLQVGGGTNKASQLKIFDTSTTPALIGFIGDDTAGTGYVGAWFRKCGIGGTATAPGFFADSAGNVVAQTLMINDVSGTHGLIGTFTGPSGSYTGMWVQRLLIGGTSPATAKIACDASGSVTIASSVTIGSGQVTGLGSLATQSSVTTGQVTGLGSLAGKNYVLAGTGDISGLGSLALKNSVAAGTGDVSGFGNLATMNLAGLSVFAQPGVTTIGPGYIASGTITAAISITSPTINGGAVYIAGGGVSVSIDSNGFTGTSTTSVIRLTSLGVAVSSVSSPSTQQVALQCSSSASGLNIKHGSYSVLAQAIDGSQAVVSVSAGSSNITLDAGTAQINIGGNRILTVKQTGPGNTTDATDVAARFNALLTALRAHGMIT